MDLWDGTTWALNEAQVSVEAYGRSTTSGSLGRTRRIAKSTRPLDDRWQCLRVAATGQTYLIASHHTDQMHGHVYNHVYQIDEAPYPIDIIHFQTQKRASGAAGSAVPTVVGQTYGACYRSEAEGSDTFESLTYVAFEIEMPVAMKPLVTRDAVLRMNGSEFDVAEVVEADKALLVRATRRAA